MRILFISTHNFATNPRLVKEIKLALENNYHVSVVCCEFDSWSRSNNDEIKSQLVPRIQYYKVSGDRSSFFLWLASSFIFLLSKYLLSLFPGNKFLLSYRSNKRSWLLAKRLQAIKTKIDLVVAHNIGSFLPAMQFAAKEKIPFGIDLEDYHPGETTNVKESEQLARLLKLTLPKAVYLTAASPLIAEFSQKISGRVTMNPVIVQNFFYSDEFVLPANNKSGKLKLVWFSQNISFNRGLEKIIPLVAESRDMELHLYGNCNEHFREHWIGGKGNIFLHPPLPQEKLHKKLAEYDVGLAVEPGKDLNNDLAVSNKILAYLQSGIFILASDTSGQKDLIEKNEGAGILTTLMYEDLQSTFSNLFKNIDNIRAGSIKRYENAKKNCWESESEKLLKLWKETTR